jgi:hypothetical protein
LHAPRPSTMIDTRTVTMAAVRARSEFTLRCELARLEGPSLEAR